MHSLARAFTVRPSDRYRNIKVIALVSILCYIELHFETNIVSIFMSVLFNGLFIKIKGNKFWPDIVGPRIAFLLQLELGSMQ